VRIHVRLLVVCIVLSVRPLSAEGDLRLVEAVKKHDIAAARSLLNQRVDPNSAQPDGATALHWAAYHDATDLADLLIRAGANVNTRNDLGATPLTLACVNGSEGMVEKLLTAGADPNTALPTGETALMTCARTGNVNAVKTLLTHRAAVNAKDRTRGQTALMWAAAARHTGVVELLIEFGADVHGRTEVTKGLVYTGMRYITSPPPVSSGTVVEINQGGFTPLLFVAQKGDVATAKVLMAAGANVNDTAPAGTSALVLAVHSDNESVAEYLLDQGADPDAAGAGYTALHAAVLRGNLHLVKTLLARGANPNARLEKGTPVKKYSQDYALSAAWIGATPLWLAARFAEASIARALAAAGADPQAALPDGTGPLLAAVVPSQGPQDRRERYLYPIEAASIAPDEAENKTLDTVRLLVELGSPVGTSNQAGDTAVHLAASAGFGSVIQFLADKGADLRATNKRGLTPLALATGGGRRGPSGNTTAATAAGTAGATNAANTAVIVPEPGVRERLKATADLLRKLGAQQ
jgi:ankyrin repeat protein